MFLLFSSRVLLGGKVRKQRKKKLCTEIILNPQQSPSLLYVHIMCVCFTGMLVKCVVELSGYRWTTLTTSSEAFMRGINRSVSSCLLQFIVPSFLRLQGNININKSHCNLILDLRLLLDPISSSTNQVKRWKEMHFNFPIMRSNYHNQEETMKREAGTLRS